MHLIMFQEEPTSPDVARCPGTHFICDSDLYLCSCAISDHVVEPNDLYVFNRASRTYPRSDSGSRGVSMVFQK